jgi:hypothetical protein
MSDEMREFPGEIVIIMPGMGAGNGGKCDG